MDETSLKKFESQQHMNGYEDCAFDAFVEIWSV